MIEQSAGMPAATFAAVTVMTVLVAMAQLAIPGYATGKAPVVLMAMMVVLMSMVHDFP